MSSIELKQITKIFKKDEQPVVDDFSITVNDKECLVLVGPSGCGKTTILRMIAGLTEITKGELLMDGENMAGVLTRNRGIGMVFQNPALYPHMTVYQNMAFGLNDQKMGKKKTTAEIRNQIEKTAAILELTPYLNRQPGKLSGGQKQRVAIGRAIAREPGVLLMDEPLSNLDPQLRIQMRAELAALRTRLDTTCIYVTHDQTEAMTLGDRILVMKDGRAEQTGTAQVIYNQPETVFVAGFMGSPGMNFFKNIEIEKNAGESAVRIEKQNLIFSGKWIEELEKRKILPTDVILGLRPEHIKLETDPRRGITGVVESSEWLGSETLIHVRVGETRLCIRVPKQMTFLIDSTICFSFELKDIHLFDQNSKRRL